MKAEVRETYPLSWPDGWVRTRIQDRRLMNGWKRTANQYREALKVELERMKCPAFVISCNVPLSARGMMASGLEPPDVGVAVWFSREAKPDYSWQEALGINDPGPTEEIIQTAYRRLARMHHPDVGGDMAVFQALTKHRDNALAWVHRRSGRSLDHVIACDAFHQVRWNLASIGLTLKAIRQIDRCGTTSLMERAFKGFSALNAAPEGSVAV